MRPVELCALAQLLVAVKFATCLEESFSSDSQEPRNHHNQQQQGSWAHWWSYDGISGPEHWNINKRWRLCSLGRKQSPVDIRTERLVYDHLLGPIHLSWSPSAQLASQTDKQHKQDQIRLRLVNSGRGVEAWLPEAPAQSQLILSRGPLSYEYGLFKIELHSAATAAAAGSTFNQANSRPNRIDTNELAAGKADRQDGGSEQADDDEEVEPPDDYLRAGKSSEHLIDGRHFEAELQLHFYNRRLASSAAEAQQLAGQDEGRPSLFAAISVFLVTSSSSSSPNVSHDHPVDELMLNNLGSLVNQGDSMELLVGREQLERLVPDRRHYITYQGSMNRPPCSESVDWIISNRPLRMDPGKFRGLYEKLNTNQENIRPVRPLNRRLLRTTINNLHSGHQPSASLSPSTSTSSSSSSSSSLGIQQEARSRQLATLAAGSYNNININGPSEELASTMTTIATSNCSGREDPTSKQQCQQQGRTKESSRPGSCSMKPRYVYQLTYGGAGGSTW